MVMNSIGNVGGRNFQASRLILRRIRECCIRQIVNQLSLKADHLHT